MPFTMSKWNLTQGQAEKVPDTYRACQFIVPLWSPAHSVICV